GPRASSTQVRRLSAAPSSYIRAPARRAFRGPGLSESTPDARNASGVGAPRAARAKRAEAGVGPRPEFTSGGAGVCPRPPRRPPRKTASALGLQRTLLLRFELGEGLGELRFL